MELFLRWNGYLLGKAHIIISKERSCEKLNRDQNITLLLAGFGKDGTLLENIAAFAIEQ